MECARRFNAYVSGDRQAIHPNLRLTIFSVAIKNGGKKEYEALKQEYLSTDSVDGREICLQAMGGVEHTDLVSDFLDFQFSNNVAPQDVHTGSIILAANPKARYVLWQYIKTNWEAVYTKLSINSVVSDRFIKNSLVRFSDLTVSDDIEKLFCGKDTKAYARGLSQVLDTIKANARYKERDERLIME